VVVVEDSGWEVVGWEVVVVSVGMVEVDVDELPPVVVVVVAHFQGLY
jgi:hypothetical protein